MQKTFFDGISTQPHDAKKAAQRRKWRKYYVLNGEAHKERNRKYYAANREREKARLKERRRNNPEKTAEFQRKYSLKRDYKLTLEAYEKMYEQQAGCCAICAEHIAFRSKFTHIDHDHATGKVRALLCHLCNMMIGAARDNGEVLHKAICYLNDHKIQIEEENKPS